LELGGVEVAARSATAEIPRTTGAATAGRSTRTAAIVILGLQASAAQGQAGYHSQYASQHCFNFHIFVLFVVELARHFES
jgi:hypothetical protein